MPRPFPVLLAFALSASAVHTAPRSPKPASTSTLTSALGGDEKIEHALNRLGFGPRPGDLQRVRAQGLGAWIDEQLHPERLDDSEIEGRLANLALLHAPPSTLMLAHEYDTARSIKLLRLMQAVQNKKPGSPRAQKARARYRLAERRARAEQKPALDGAMENAERPGGMDRADEFARLPPGEQEKARQLEARAQAAGITQGAAAQAVGELASAKVARAAQSRRQLQEVLADFWGNHFNLDVRKGPVRTLKVVDEREVIRPRVLGRFRDLLGASAHSPAMLFYLDNARSVAPQRRGGRMERMPRARRGGVNENYARELLELHTLGVGGGYTQKDVQEVARCFTGWSIDRAAGTFRFNPRAHDSDPKTVLGQNITSGGQKDGEQVLDILASHPSTARFLSRKLCVRLVSDDPPQVLVDRVAKKWIATEGDLRAVVAEISLSPEFYARGVARAKIKSPFEFAVSAVRALDATVTLPDASGVYGAQRMRVDGRSLLYAGGRRAQGGLRPSMSQMIAAMGQPLFAFQAPTGFPEDSRRWVSSGALIARLNFALALSQGQVAHVQMPKNPVLEGLSGDDHSAVLARLDERLLGGAMTQATRTTLSRHLQPGTPADPIKLSALVLGAPEFQRR